MLSATFAVLLAIAPPSTDQAPNPRVVNRRIERDQTVAKALREVGVDEAQTAELVGALSSVFDCRKSNWGDQIRIVVRSGQVDFFDYRRGPVEEFHIRRDQDRWIAVQQQVELETRVQRVELSVSSSLYESAQAAGEDPTIALSLSDVFAWDIDFYQDVQKGDRVRLLVEKVLSSGRFIRYGEILAAEYQGMTVGRKRVFRYQLPDGSFSYFQEDGSSARKSFLKSPLKYAHVTSGFGSRFHPVLQYVKAHNGVDYGTPVGTPVWAVADGTVVKAGRDATSGNHLCLRHMSSLETCYLHLSRFGAGVRTGARVYQKQVIAYSGNTGRSTGPHLHYALRRGGQFVNPLKQNFPRADPVPQSLLADFQEKTSGLSSRLDAQPVAAVFH